MNHLIKLGLACFFILWSFTSSAQFWFGPKIGLNMTNSVYDDKTYKSRYDVKPVLDWQAGFSIDYDAEGRFDVHTELTYERVSSSISNISGNPRLDASSVYHFISLPMMVRVVFAGKNSAVKFYGQAGPRMKFWLAGNGVTITDQVSEAGFDGYGYKVAFKSVADRDDSGVYNDGPNANGDVIVAGWEYIVEKPNRVQYSIDFGGGVFVDLSNGHRLNFDARISWGHSNMGFNVAGDGLNLDDFGLNLDNFDEDLEYHHNMLTFSAAYLIGFDPLLANKGKSTNPTAKKKKKK